MFSSIQRAVARSGQTCAPEVRLLTAHAARTAFTARDLGSTTKTSFEPKKSLIYNKIHSRCEPTNPGNQAGADPQRPCREMEGKLQTKPFSLPTRTKYNPCIPLNEATTAHPMRTGEATASHPKPPPSEAFLCVLASLREIFFLPQARRHRHRRTAPHLGHSQRELARNPYPAFTTESAALPGAAPGNRCTARLIPIPAE